MDRSTIGWEFDWFKDKFGIETYRGKDNSGIDSIKEYDDSTFIFKYDVGS